MAFSWVLLSDLINGAIEALIAERYELPALSTLRRLAGGGHAQATQDWFSAVSRRLNDDHQRRLDDLLAVPKDARESEFATLCKPTKRVSRNHLGALLEHGMWDSRKCSVLSGTAGMHGVPLMTQPRPQAVSGGMASVL